MKLIGIMLNPITPCRRVFTAALMMTTMWLLFPPAVLAFAVVPSNHHSCEFFVPLRTTVSSNSVMYYYHSSFPVVADTTRTRRLPLPPRTPTSTTTQLKLSKLPTDSSESNDTTATNDSNNNNNWLLSLCIPLWLVYISNQWSRSSLYYLVDFSGTASPVQAMNVDLSFSQSQYGLLASIAFTSLFAIASLGAGIASDRYNRKTLTIVSALMWSGATMGTSLSNTYEQVVLWRIAMGLACAFSTPTAYTLIQQLVPKDKTALASSFYGTGVALGGAFASLSILLDTQLGWRHALWVISGFGVVTSLTALLLLPNDPKEADQQQNLVTNKTDNKDGSYEKPSSTNDLTNQVVEIFSTPRIQWLYLGTFLRFCSGLMIGVWSAPYFRMVFSENQADYAVAQAAITAGCGVVSGLLGGYIADKISSSSNNKDVGSKLWVPVVGSLLAAPAWYLSVHSEGSFSTAMTWLALEYFVAECWFGPTVSVLQSTVGPAIGGTAQGIFTLTGAVGNLAPSLLGYLYATMSPTLGDESSSTLATLLSVGICGGYISSAACFVIASQCTPPLLEEEQQMDDK